MFKGWSYQVNGISSNWSEYNWKHTNATRCALLAKERIKSIDYTEVQKGDIIFNYSSTNSNYNERFDHVVIAADDFNQATSTCKVHGHTQNKRDWDKPLNSSNCKCYHVLPEIKVEYCERKFLLPETGNGASPQ